MKNRIASLANCSQGTRLRRSEVLKSLKGRAGRSLLECGCGAGSYSRFLKESVGSVCAFDLNPKLVGAAAAQASGVGFFVGDAQNIPVRGSTFDFVIATDILEHLPKPEKAIGNFRGLLKKNGLVICTVPSRKWEPVYSALKMKKEDVGHRRLYDPDELKALFEAGGFDLVVGRRIQNVVSAFLDALVAKSSLVIFGEGAVLHSEMTTEAAGHGLLSVLYYCFNRAVYPLLRALEWITPRGWKVENLAIFRIR